MIKGIPSPIFFLTMSLAGGRRAEMGKFFLKFKSGPHALDFYTESRTIYLKHS
jgi:hypothetical protein